MALAEIQELITRLSLDDRMSGGLNKATRSVGTLNNRTMAATGTLGRAGGAMGRLGGIASRLTGNIGRLAGPLGFGGLTLSVAGFVIFAKKAVDKSQEFIATSQALAKVTGQNISNASQLVDVLDKYGLSGEAAIRTFGLLERNVQTLAGTTEKAAAFQKEYGFSLTDSNGKIADVNELLRRSRDYFNGSATASQKATVLARLYGRSWQQLIPLLSLSREQLEHQFDTALKLTPLQIKNLIALRNSQRELNDTIGDTQVLIGLALTPALTKAARALNSFITQNQAGIVALFEKGAAFAGELASAINQYVVPALGGIAKAWNSIPGELRHLLIAGFIGNKILKMTIGFDPLDILRKQVTGLFSRGGNPLTPLFVQEVGPAGLLRGGGPGILPVAGGLTAAGIATAIAGGLAIAAGFKILVQDPVFDEATRKIVADAKRQIALPSTKTTELAASRRAVQQAIRELRALPGGELLYAGQIAALEDLDKRYYESLRLRGVTGPVLHPATPREEVFVTPGQHGAQTFQKEAPRSPRTILTPEKLKQALGEQNRANPLRRDLNDTKFRIVQAVRGVQSGIVTAVQIGNANVVSAVWGVEAAIRGKPWFFGETGRGTGPGGRPPAFHSPDMPGPGKATGGLVRRGFPYWVGERGPETFVPNEDGRILPATQFVAPDGSRWPSKQAYQRARAYGNRGAGLLQLPGVQSFLMREHQSRPIVAQVNISARDVTDGQSTYRRYTPVRDR